MGLVSWIDVRDKLPDHGTRVLVTIVRDQSPPVTHVAFYDSELGWRWGAIRGKLQRQEMVTHWQRLPDPANPKSVLPK